MGGRVKGDPNPSQFRQESPHGFAFPHLNINPNPNHHPHSHSNQPRLAPFTHGGAFITIGVALATAGLLCSCSFHPGNQGQMGDDFSRAERLYEPEDEPFPKGKFDGEEKVDFQYEDAYLQYLSNRYDEVVFLKGGAACVVKGDRSHKLLGLDGQSVIPQYFEGCKYISPGRFALRKDNLWGVVDDTGRVIKKFEWQNLRPLGEVGYAVKKDGLWGAIREYGDELYLPTDFDGVESAGSRFTAIFKNRKWALVDNRNPSFMNFTYDDIRPLAGGMIALEKDGYVGMADPFGKVVLSVEFNDADMLDNLAVIGALKLSPGKYYSLSYKIGDEDVPLLRGPGRYYLVGNFVLVNKGDRPPSITNPASASFIYKAGQFIPFKVDAVSNLGPDRFKVAKNGKWGVVDSNGKWVVPARNSDIREAAGKYIFAIDESKLRIYLKYSPDKAWVVNLENSGPLVRDHGKYVGEDWFMMKKGDGIQLIYLPAGKIVEVPEAVDARALNSRVMALKSDIFASRKGVTMAGAQASGEADKPTDGDGYEWLIVNSAHMAVWPRDKGSDVSTYSLKAYPASEPRLEDVKRDPMQRELSFVKKDGLWGVVDKSFKFVLPPKWKRMRSHPKFGIYEVMDENGKWGLMTRSGVVVMKPEHDELTFVDELDIHGDALGAHADKHDGFAHEGGDANFDIMEDREGESHHPHEHHLPSKGDTVFKSAKEEAGVFVNVDNANSPPMVIFTDDGLSGVASFKGEIVLPREYIFDRQRNRLVHNETKEVIDIARWMRLNW